jgi:endonuclease/exonuclease/phosphatase family protein
MRFRAATLNLEQDHKRWDARRELVVEQLGDTRPDVLALNEVCLPRRTAHWLRDGTHLPGCQGRPARGAGFAPSAGAKWAMAPR